MKIDIEKIKEKKTTKELLEFGIINIDKPTGPTSFSITDFVRKSLNLNKASHMGTLDPQVTGVGRVPPRAGVRPGFPWCSEPGNSGRGPSLILRSPSADRAGLRVPEHN